MKAINRRFIALLLAGILFSLIVPLRSGAAESGTVFLWEVKSEKAAAYLLGSIHLMKAQFYPLPDTIENAFARSDTLVVEADIEEAGPEKLQELMQAGALYPAGDSLKNHLSSATYEQVAAKLRSYGMDFTFFNSVQPWALALTLTTIELTRLGFDPEYGIDRHFIRKARGAKKILALESAEYQINLLRDFSEKDQEFFLLYTLKDLDKAGTETDRIVTAWSSGDTGTVEAILLE
ncbi:MAG: TraB/GumN family protein, partial [bacterium]